MDRRYILFGLWFFAAAVVLGLGVAALAPLAGIRAFGLLGVLFGAGGVLLHLYALKDLHPRALAPLRQRLDLRSREAAQRWNAFTAATSASAVACPS